MIPITPGTGASIATDEISGQHYQKVKMVVGADGAATPVSSANPLPVTAGVVLDTLGAMIPNFASLPVAYGYNGDNKLTTETITAGSDTYTRTYAYTSGNLTSISGWVKA